MNLELEANPAEPRRGIAPFAGGAKIQRTRGYEVIISKPTQFPDLGNGSVILNRPLGRKVFDDTFKSEQAFTMDILGNTYRGSLREFLESGYYVVEAVIRPYNPPRGQPVQKLNAWIEGTGPIITAITANLKTNHDGSAVATFGRSRAAEGTWEKFVLLNREEMLKALRIDVSNN